MSDLISRQEVLKTFDSEIEIAKIDIEIVANYIKRCFDRIKAIPPIENTCEGCKHVGTHDIDYPCNVCVRREKDYYESE